MVRRKRIPIITRLGQDIRQFRLRNVLRLFDRINIQPSTNMPCDMTVQRPSARIVRFVFNDQIAWLGRRSLGHNLDVAPDGVRRVGSLDGAVPGLDTVREDPEVVAMEMHGVGDLEKILDVDTHRRVGAEIVDVCFFGKIEIAGGRLGEDGVARSVRLVMGV